jgi:hypothetical protein
LTTALGLGAFIGLKFLLPNPSHFLAMNIRLAVESDFAAMWPIFQATVETGTTYVFAPETSHVANASFMVAPGRHVPLP